ncbi:MAG TPA: phosphodiester glycosidase family protein [Tepidisphaeraceae bacterium]|jgi:hypothetical protein
MARRVFILFTLCLAMAASQATAQATRPSPIAVQQLARKNPDQRLVVARVDLTDPRVAFNVAAAGPDPDGEGVWETILRPTSAIAAEHGFDLAINTVFFQHKTEPRNAKAYLTGQWARSNNLLMNDGNVLAPARGGVSLVIEEKNRAYVTVVGAMPPAARTIVTGNVLLLSRGRDVTDPADTARHPRTAVGLTRDYKTLVLLTVDGRREGWSLGMTMSELAAEMLAQGCSDAFNLDGGGSTTIVGRQPDGKHKVLNVPSDGSTLIIPLSIERPVPYVFGVTVKEPAAPATRPAPSEPSP